MTYAYQVSTPLVNRTDSLGRRRYLQLIGGVAALGAAGCSEPSGEGDTVEEQGTTEREPQDGPVQNPNESGTQEPGRGPAEGPGEGNETLERDQSGVESNESGSENGAAGGDGNGAENGMAGDTQN